MTAPEPIALATIPGGPSRGTLLVALADLAAGQSKVFEYRQGDQRFEMFLHRHGDRVVAFENRCPHAGMPLDWTPGRFLDMSGVYFLCSVHGAQFQIVDGFCIHGPCSGAGLRPVRIVLRDGGVYSD